MSQSKNPLFFYGLYALSFYAGFRILLPFWQPIVGAIALGVVFYPMFLWIKKRLGPKHERWAALLSDAAVFVFFITPVVLVGWAVSVEAAEAAPAIQQGFKQFIQWTRSHSFNNVLRASWMPEAVRHLISGQAENLQNRLAGMVQGSVTFVALAGKNVAGNLISFVIQFFVFLLVLFFAFEEGPGLLNYCLRLVPMEEADKTKIVEKCRLTIDGVFKGTFLTGIVQGACAALGFLIVGTEGSILLGVLCAIGTLIPSVGTGLVTVPVGLVYLATGHPAKGIFVLIWGIFVVGLIDNLLRPLLVGSKADIPFLWLFLGILGGLNLFGVFGLLLGPLIIVIIPVLSDIYLHHYKSAAK